MLPSSTRETPSLPPRHLIGKTSKSYALRWLKNHHILKEYDAACASGLLFFIS